jgi:hypothetical protein
MRRRIISYTYKNRWHFDEFHLFIYFASLQVMLCGILAIKIISLSSTFASRNWWTQIHVHPSAYWVLPFYVPSSVPIICPLCCSYICVRISLRILGLFLVLRSSCRRVSRMKKAANWNSHRPCTLFLWLESQISYPLDENPLKTVAKTVVWFYEYYWYVDS